MVQPSRGIRRITPVTIHAQKEIPKFTEALIRTPTDLPIYHLPTRRPPPPTIKSISTLHVLPPSTPPHLMSTGPSNVEESQIFYQVQLLSQISSPQHLQPLQPQISYHQHVQSHAWMMTSVRLHHSRPINLHQISATPPGWKPRISSTVYSSLNSRKIFGRVRERH